MSIHQTTRGSLELTAAMVLSGTIGYFVIASGQSALNVVLARCLFGAIALGLYLALRGGISRNMFKTRLLFLIAAGGLALVANWVLLFESFRYVPFSIATATYHVQPLMLVIVGAWVVGERPSGSVWIWLAIAFAGLYLIIEITPTDLIAVFSSQQSGAITGIALALAAAALYTATSLLAKKTSEAPPHFVALVQVSLGALLLAPFADFGALPDTTSSWLNLATLGIIHTGLMYILLYASFQKLTTSLIAVLSFIYPVVALLVDHLAFDTQIKVSQGLGVALILIAGIAVRLEWKITEFQIPKARPRGDG